MRRLLIGKVDPLVDVTIEIENAEGGHALFVRADGFSLIQMGHFSGACGVFGALMVREKVSSLLSEGLVQVALRRFSGISSGVGTHFFTFTGEVEFLLGA
jgi:hypothetical protein